jgi:hypothetical protein
MRERLVIQVGLLLICAIFLSAIVGSLIHEAAHIVVFWAGGSQLKGAYVAPGIQLYPEIKKVKWSGYVCGVSMSESSSDFVRGLSLVMGSTANAVASYLLLTLVFLKCKGWKIKLVLLLVSFLFAWDLIGYSIFPLFDLRHWIFIGGDYAEPIVGASMLGIPLWASYLIVFVHVFVFHFIFRHAFLSISENLSELKDRLVR